MLGSGLPGESNYLVVRDWLKILKDFLRRLQQGEPLEILMHDLYYAIEAEFEIPLNPLSATENKETPMNKSFTLDHSSEPTTIRPL